MPRLIWVFAGAHKSFCGFAMRQLIFYLNAVKNIFRVIHCHVRCTHKIEPRHEKNLSSGFATRVDSNWPVQPQKLDRLEILDTETRGIILSRRQTTKALMRMRGCPGWSGPLLFAYGINRFSHDVAQFNSNIAKVCIQIKWTVNLLVQPREFCW